MIAKRLRNERTCSCRRLKIAQLVSVPVLIAIYLISSWERWSRYNKRLARLNAFYRHPSHAHYSSRWAPAKLNLGRIAFTTQTWGELANSRLKLCEINSASKVNKLSSSLLLRCQAPLGSRDLMVRSRSWEGYNIILHYDAISAINNKQNAFFRIQPASLRCAQDEFMVLRSQLNVLDNTTCLMKWDTLK